MVIVFILFTTELDVCMWKENSLSRLPEPRFFFIFHESAGNIIM